MIFFGVMNPKAAKIVTVVVAMSAGFAAELYFDRWWNASRLQGNLYLWGFLSFVIIFGITFALCKLLFRLLPP